MSENGIEASAFYDVATPGWPMPYTDRRESARLFFCRFFYDFYAQSAFCALRINPARLDIVEKRCAYLRAYLYKDPRLNFARLNFAAKLIARFLLVFLGGIGHFHLGNRFRALIINQK